MTKAKSKTMKLGFYSPQVVRAVLGDGGTMRQGYGFEEEFRLADLLFPASWDFLERKHDYRVVVDFVVSASTSLFVTCKLSLAETRQELNQSRPGSHAYRGLVAADIVASNVFDEN